jgi:hypothetical protein
MSGPIPKPGTSPLGDRPMSNDQASKEKNDEATEAAESDVGEEDPGSALDSGETETVTRDDVRSSEA